MMNKSRAVFRFIRIIKSSDCYNAAQSFAFLQVVGVFVLLSNSRAMSSPPAIGRINRFADGLDKNMARI
jgi:hypothetical protein